MRTRVQLSSTYGGGAGVVLYACILQAGGAEPVGFLGLARQLVQWKWWATSLLHDVLEAEKEGSTPFCEDWRKNGWRRAAFICFCHGSARRFCASSSSSLGICAPHCAGLGHQGSVTVVAVGVQRTQEKALGRMSRIHTLASSSWPWSLALGAALLPPVVLD